MNVFKGGKVRDKIINPFNSKSEAKRYQNFRPQYHDLAFLPLERLYGKKFENTLDVACGTGHSTFALQKISNNIIGVDLSEAMIAEAQRFIPNVHFKISGAECLPFPDQIFNLVNVSQGFQWFDQYLFLKEVRRILKADGLLSIDNCGFSGEVASDEHFYEKFRYFDNLFFKSALRSSNYPDESMLEVNQLKLLNEFGYEHIVNMDHCEFIKYLMTRSNFLVLNDIEKVKMEKKLFDCYQDDFSRGFKKIIFRGKLSLYSLL